MRISDWSSDVCSSDLQPGADRGDIGRGGAGRGELGGLRLDRDAQFVELAQQADRRTPFEQPAQHVGVEQVPVAFGLEIGRASCRGRGCQFVSSSVVAGSLKKKNKKNKTPCISI